MGYTNSPLTDITIISPATNYYRPPRSHAIDRITPHMVVGQCTATALGQVFALESRGATSNYGIGYDGQVGLYCEEYKAAGTSSSFANDNRAITIEIASDNYYPYTIRSAAEKKAIELMADICKRNGKDTLVWKGTKAAALAYSDNGQKANEMLITFHEWFGATACPGAYIENHITEWVAKVNAILKGGSSATTTASVTLFEEAQKMIRQGINGMARINQATADGFEPTEVQGQIDIMMVKKKDIIMKSIFSVLPVVRDGSTGDAVRIVQHELKRLGYYDGAIDGVAGSKTVAAIKEIQTDWNIVFKNVSVDGSFGPQCWNRLLIQTA